MVMDVGGASVGTQPVTFSPTVVEPSLRRQGILKKHCSLDDGRRSTSPPTSLRRASLEEPQSILKRKISRDEVCPLVISLLSSLMYFLKTVI